MRSAVLPGPIRAASSINREDLFREYEGPAVPAAMMAATSSMLCGGLFCEAAPVRRPVIITRDRPERLDDTGGRRVKECL